MRNPDQQDQNNYRDPWRFSWPTGPGEIYLTGEEWLRITTIGNSSLVVTCTGRVLNKEGVVNPFSFNCSVSQLRTPVVTNAPLPEGWLIGLTLASNNGNGSYGDCWARADLIRGFGTVGVILQTITSGFTSLTYGPTFPESETDLALIDAGGFLMVLGSTPGAGVDISETMPGNTRRTIEGFTATLTTSAAVANRVVTLTIDDGANVWYRIQAAANIAATLVTPFTFARGLNAQPTGIGGVVHLPFPNDVKIPANHRIRTVTTNIQAGDQWSQPIYLVREWFDT